VRRAIEAAIAVTLKDRSDLFDRAADFGRTVPATILVPAIEDDSDGCCDGPGLPRQDAEIDSKFAGGGDQPEPVGHPEDLTAGCALDDASTENLLRLSDSGDDALDARGLDSPHEGQSSNAVGGGGCFLEIVSKPLGSVRASVIEYAKPFFRVGIDVYYANLLAGSSAFSGFIDFGDYT
jgi:hypothetical protein